jgi:hypothetical protein
MTNELALSGFGFVDASPFEMEMVDGGWDWGMFWAGAGCVLGGSAMIAGAVFLATVSSGAATAGSVALIGAGSTVIGTGCTVIITDAVSH